MIRKLIAILKELFTPSSLKRVEASPAAQAYGRAAIGAYHACLGCAACVALVWLGVAHGVAVLLIAAVYLFKELHDVLVMHGTVLDSIEDSVFTILGAVLANSLWFAPIVLLVTLVLMICTVK